MDGVAVGVGVGVGTSGDGGEAAMATMLFLLAGRGAAILDRIRVATFFAVHSHLRGMLGTPWCQQL
jgi:hypothetical protein